MIVLDDTRIEVETIDNRKFYSIGGKDEAGEAHCLQRRKGRIRNSSSQQRGRVSCRNVGCLVSTILKLKKLINFFSILCIYSFSLFFLQEFHNFWFNETSLSEIRYFHWSILLM